MAVEGVFRPRGQIHDRRRPSCSPSSRTAGAAARRTVCRFWLQGRCTRLPCAFLHSRDPQVLGVGEQAPRRQRRSPPRSLVWRNPNAAAASTAPPHRPPASDGSHLRRRTQSGDADIQRSSATDAEAHPGPIQDPPPPPPERNGDGGVHGDDDGVAVPRRSTFSLLGSFAGGHSKAVTGIALPSGCHKIFTGSADGTVCVWDKNNDGDNNEHTPAQVIELVGPVSSLIAEGAWVFAGARGQVHACNTSSGRGHILPGTGGQVSTLASSDDAIFAGLEDGSILAWKAILDPTSGEDGVRIEPAVSLRGHTSGVTSLAIGRGRLYSGAQDGSIRAWNIGFMEAVEEFDTLPAAHGGAVTSLLCWCDYLLSASPDGTVKVWRQADKDNGRPGLEEVYAHHEQQGVLLISGTADDHGGAVLNCSLSDGTVRLRDLPTFHDRGCIECSGQARALHSAGAGGFFIGDASGQIRQWRWSSQC